MARIFITGSSDGLGLLSAQALTKRGHDVYLHARNADRAKDARAACPLAKGVLIADFSSPEATKSLASELNKLGPWDTIIHNAGVMRAPGKTVFNVNTLAPYLLTCLVDPPAKRYLFLSSGMHQSGDASFRDIEHCRYSDTKLHNIMLANWFARQLGVVSNSMDPGWVPTKMGRAGAPDDIGKAVETYVMLAETDSETGKHWFQSRQLSAAPAAGHIKKQDQLIDLLEQISGVSPPV